MTDIKILEESVEEAPTPKWLSCAIEGAVLLAALVLILFLRWNVWEIAVVTSNSMQPTLTRGDRLLVDHRAALQNKWQRGDIVIFDAPPSWGAPDILVKRVIALPGETVQVYGGRVYVNGRILPETYLNGSMIRERFAPVMLAPHEYFVLGDNRNDSEDSRDHGPVESRFIRGRALRVVWPPGRTGKLKRPVYP